MTYANAACVLLGLLYLASATAAPAPPPPPLSEKMLVGKWDFTFSDFTFNGEITFGDDGTYEVLFQQGRPKYGGKWWIVNKDTVVLWESGKRPDGSTYEPGRYRFTLDSRTLTGRTPQGWPVRLSKPPQ